MTKIYCGNNSQDLNVLNGTKVIGTRYDCLRQGIGKGLNLPYDPKYNGSYNPIDKRKIYCGNKPQLPNKYDLVGNLPQCLQKGVGVGKRIRSTEYAISSSNNEKLNLSPTFSFTSINRKSGINKHILFRIIYFILSVVASIVLYKIKPKVVLAKTSKKNKKEINWSNFLVVYFVINMTILGVLSVIKKFI